MKRYKSLKEKFENPQILTPEFKKWFGNSKVVKGGKPLIVYHGTNSNFNVFKPSKMQGTHKEIDQIEGMYFTDSFEGASFYALTTDDRFLKKVYLSMKKPFRVKSYAELKNIFKIESYNQIGKIIQKKGKL